MAPAPLKVAVQSDPLEAVDIDADSTFALSLEAQDRGHALYHYSPRCLSFENGDVRALARRFEVRRERGNHITLEAAEVIDLRAVDVVLMRQDPPFDMAYITATHILEHLAPDTLVVNDPFEVRNAPEKLFVTHFEGLMPPTLISNQKKEIDAFRAEHGDIILKPLFGNGGAGVFRVKADDENYSALLEMFSQFYKESLIAQRYLPENRQGDKRIILVDGRAAGAINRIPAAGETRSNLHVGGKAEKTELTPRDLEICQAIGPELARRGLLFVGIDVIGGYLTEINVTSPTGIQEIARLDGADLAGEIWDAIEARLR